MNQKHNDYDITEAMITFGGGFVSMLGKLWRMGDLVNQKILKETFASYWDKYDDPLMHKRIKERDI